MCAADSRPHLCSSIHKVAFSAAADGGSMPSFQKGSGSFLPYLPLGFCVWIVIITRPALGSRNLVCRLIRLECLSPVSTRGAPLRPPTQKQCCHPCVSGQLWKGALFTSGNSGLGECPPVGSDGQGCGRAYSSHLVMAGWGSARPREVMGRAVAHSCLKLNPFFLSLWPRSAALCVTFNP